MLKKWIEEIRKQSDLYKTDSWKYQISGNVIELSILPVYLKDKRLYRCSVIAVGQAIKALSCCIEKQHFSFHIQSFPIIENAGLVATIRMDRANSFLPNLTQDKSRILQQNQPKIALQTLAEQYQLHLQEVQHPAELDNTDVNPKDYTSWFILSSNYNNPFTWLTIGYWKESVQNDCRNQLPSQTCQIIDLLSTDKDSRSQLSTKKDNYPQLLIGIKPLNFSG